MHPIIVAYDGSPNARDALAFAAFAAELDHAPLEVVCAYPTGGRAAHAYDEATRAAATDELDKARAELPDGVRASFASLPATSLGKALHEHAEERQAQVIVLGSSRHGVARRATAGTLAGQLLHGAPCPVAVVPAGWAAREQAPPTRVVLGYDAGPDGERALTAAEELARRARLPLELVTAVPDALIVAGGWPAYTVPAPDGDQAVALAQERLEQAAARVDSVVPVHTDVLIGGAVRGLRDHAGPDDLLVLGSRAYGPLRSVLLGSVSKGVVADCPCPVLVVPRGSTPSPRDEAAQPAEAELASASL